jgi:hypothetical protein
MDSHDYRHITTTRVNGRRTGVHRRRVPRMTWRRCSLPALAIAALLVLFGHELLMAADLHAPSPVHGEHAVGQAPVDTDCGVPEGARPSSRDDPAFPMPLASLPVSSETQPVCHSSLAAWSIEPSHPPDVLRALLQVYLN